MRRPLFTLLLVAALACALALGGCKTNEKNMSDAYTKAMAAREAVSGLDSTIYTKVRRQMSHGSMIVGSDSVDFSSQWVAITKDAGGTSDSLKPFCVVVGQFKQLFNAKSMRERLSENGYPGAFVVETGEPYYFVVAGSFTEASDAVRMLDRAQSDRTLRMKEPLPFILRPAQFR